MGEVDVHFAPRRNRFVHCVGQQVGQAVVLDGEGVEVAVAQTARLQGAQREGRFAPCPVGAPPRLVVMVCRDPA